MFDRVIAGFDGFDGGRDAIALWQHLAPAPPRQPLPGHRLPAPSRPAGVARRRRSLDPGGVMSVDHDAAPLTSPGLRGLVRPAEHVL